MSPREQCLFQALICEREGMVAENKQREILGQSMAYTDVDFQILAEKFRAFIQ